MDLGGVDRVAKVMSLPVRNEGDQALGFAELLKDDLYDVYIMHLVVSADGVDLTVATVMKDGVHRFAVILNIKPVPDVHAVAVYREILVIKCVNEHERDELLGKLVRAVVIAASAHRNRKPECSVIGKGEQIRCRL